MALAAEQTNAIRELAPCGSKILGSSERFLEKRELGCRRNDVTQRAAGLHASQEASGNNLKAEIEDLATTGVTHPLMKDWPTEVRELANDSAHPKPNAPPTEPQDSGDIVKFLDFLLLYFSDLPKDISNYRKRRAGS